jgi:hypothetical protein
MLYFRSLVKGALVAAAVTGCAAAGVGAASAASVTPVTGGWQIDLNHVETVWTHDTGLGAVVAGLPTPAAVSFGRSLDNLTGLAAVYPQGRVSITIFGPIGDLSGTMTALAN